MSDAAVARSARNGAKKDDRRSFCMVLAVFSARKAAFAAAFFAMRRPTAGAQPGLPLGARPCSAMLVQSESQAGTCKT